MANALKRYPRTLLHYIIIILALVVVVLTFANLQSIASKQRRTKRDNFIGLYAMQVALLDSYSKGLNQYAVAEMNESQYNALGVNFADEGIQCILQKGINQETVQLYLGTDSLGYFSAEGLTFPLS